MKKVVLRAVLTGVLCCGSLAAQGPDLNYQQWRIKPIAPNRELHGKFFIANTELDKRPYGNLEKIAARYAVGLVEKFPGMPPQMANHWAREFEAAYQRKYGAQRGLDYDQVVENVKKLVSLSPSAKSIPSLPLGGIAYDEFVRMNERHRADLALQIFANVSLERLPSNSRANEKMMGRYRLLDVAEKSQTDLRVREAVDLYFSDKLDEMSLGKHALAEWSNNFHESGHLFSLVYDKALADAQGGLMTRGQLEDKLKSAASKEELLAIRERSEKQLVEMGTSLEEVNKYLQQVQDSAKKEKVAAAINAEFGLASASMDLFGAILSKDSPEAGRIYGTFSHALLETGRILALEERGAITVEDATTMGVTAALRLAQSLIFASKSADEVTQEMLRNMSGQIEGLHKEMRAQFEGVHEHLNLLQQYLHGRLGDLESAVLSSHRSLGQIKDRMTLMHSAMRTFANDERAFDVQKSVNLCLKTDPDDSLGYDQFKECIVKFYTCAMQSNDGISAGLDEGALPLDETNEEDFFTRVANIQFDLFWKNIRMVSLAAKRLGNPIAEENLINPVSWAVCVDHFMRGAEMYPEFYKKFDPARNKPKDLLESGKRLRSAINAVAYQASEEGVPGENAALHDRFGNVDLFQSLIEGHRGRLSAFSTAIDRQRKEFEAVSIKRYDFSLDGRQKPLNPLPFDREDREINGKLENRAIVKICPRGSRIEGLGPVGPPPPSDNGVTFDFNANIEAPEGLDVLVPNIYRVAHDLGLGELRFCYIAYPEHKHDYRIYDLYGVAFYAYFGETPILTRVARIPHAEIGHHDLEKNTRMSQYLSDFYALWNSSARKTFVKESSSEEIFPNWYSEYYKKFGHEHKGLSFEEHNAVYNKNRPKMEDFLLRNRDMMLLQLSQRILEGFDKHRKEFGRQLVKKALENAPPFHELGRQLTGAKQLLWVFFNIGYPQSSARFLAQIQERQKMERAHQTKESAKETLLGALKSTRGFLAQIQEWQKRERARQAKDSTKKTLLEELSGTSDGFLAQIEERQGLDATPQPQESTKKTLLDTLLDISDEHSAPVEMSRAPEFPSRIYAVTPNPSDADLVKEYDDKAYLKMFPPLPLPSIEAMKAKTTKLQRELNTFLTQQRLPQSQIPTEQHPILDGTLARLKVFTLASEAEAEADFSGF